MLTAREKEEIDAVREQYELKKAAGIEALKIVQKYRGWVSDEALCDVALELETSPAELEAVATFYSFIFRRPVGRHVILVCDSVTCFIMGYETIADHLKKRLGIDFGETTGDGRFTLLPQVCLGACDRAPVMMIDETLYGNLDAEMIEEILASFGQ